MRTIRQPAFLAAVSITVLVALYFAFVAQRAVMFLQSGDSVGRAIGAALLVLPLIGAWYLINEWRLGVVVQRMANRLEVDGRLPAFDGATRPSGRLADEAAKDAYETAAREVDLYPEDFGAWYRLAFAYDAAGDRGMARKSLRHAADLFRRRAGE